MRSRGRRPVFPYLAPRAGLALLAGGLLAAACQDDKPVIPPAGEAPTCPNQPTGEIPGGDANGDGAVDLADAIVVLRSIAEAGATPPCAAAVDLVPNERLDLDDAFSLLVHLYEGGFSLPEDVDCDDALPHPSPTCSPIEARFSESGAVELRGDTAAIEGWSLSVRADGCTVTGATTAGTLGASVVDDPPGLRDLGYDATFLVDEGVVSAVVLDFMEPVALPAGAWSPVLALTLEAGEACTCTLTLGEPVAALGEPVANLVVAGGAAWEVAAEATVDLCP